MEMLLFPRSKRVTPELLWWEFRCTSRHRLAAHFAFPRVHYLATDGLHDETVRGSLRLEGGGLFVADVGICRARAAGSGSADLWPLARVLVDSQLGGPSHGSPCDDEAGMQPN